MCRFEASKGSFLIFFRGTHGHQSNLLASKFDFEFIPGAELKQSRVGLAN